MQSNIWAGGRGAAAADFPTPIRGPPSPESGAETATASGGDPPRAGMEVKSRDQWWTTDSEKSECEEPEQ